MRDRERDREREKQTLHYVLFISHTTETLKITPFDNREFLSFHLLFFRSVYARINVKLGREREENKKRDSST